MVWLTLLLYRGAYTATPPQKNGNYSKTKYTRDFQIMKFGFSAFFEAKMTRIVILDQKLIALNDYQQFWVHFEWFLSLFQNLDVK